MNHTENWLRAFAVAIILHFSVASLGLLVIHKWKKPVSLNQGVYNVKLFNSMETIRAPKAEKKASAPIIENKPLPKIETKKAPVKKEPVQKKEEPPTKKVETVQKEKVNPPPETKKAISTNPPPPKKPEVKKEAKKPQENPDELMKKRLDNLKKESEAKKAEEAFKERLVAFESKKENALIKQRLNNLEENVAARQLDENSELLKGYMSEIGARIKPNWTLPDYLMAKKNLKTKVIVIIDNSGRIISTAVKNSSGNKVFDDFATKAVEDSNPLPTPPKEIGPGPYEIEINFVPEGMEL